MKKIVISAGELSGDEHAAKLAQALFAAAPGLQIRGMGGRNLSAAGAKLEVDFEIQGSYMGFTEVLASLGKIRASLKKMTELLEQWKPEILILVDYPDFNLRLARAAKRLGIKTFYFIIPKMWAWRSSRVSLFKEYIDKAALIFPFEREFFEKHGYMKSVYVGHPFANQIIPNTNPVEREKFLKEFNLDPNKPVLCFFPGSRSSEVKKHLLRMLGALDLLKRKHPEVQAIISATPQLEATIRAQSKEVTIVSNRALEVLKYSDAGLLKSGTSNLQAAYCELPFAMFFLANILAEIIVRTMVSFKQYSIVNIIKPNSVREIIQRSTTPKVVAPELERLLFDQEYRSKIRNALQKVTDTLTKFDELLEFQGLTTPYERVARLALST